MTIEKDFVTIDDFIRALKGMRGEHWLFFTGRVAGKHVQLKTFNHTYMQIYRIDGKNQALSGMDCTISVFNHAIKRPFIAAQLSQPEHVTFKDY